MSFDFPQSTVGLRTSAVVDEGGSHVTYQQCTNLELFEVRSPAVTPVEDMVTQAFQQAYIDACYRALVGQDALRSYGANEEFQIAIDARQPAKYQENQAFIREVVDRFYDDLLSVVIDVTDAEDRARFGPNDTTSASRSHRFGESTADGGAFSDFTGAPVDASYPSGNDGSGGTGSIECKSLMSPETRLHYVVPVLGRIVVRNGFFMCFWHSTVGERVGQIECRASRQVMEVNISHVHVPLCYHFRYKGRGVTAVSLIPIGESLTDVTEQNAEVAAIAQQVASAFNLLPYEVTGEPDTVASRTSLADTNNDAGPSCYRFLPRRVQAHFGRDGRYYLIGNIHWCIPWLNSRPNGDHALQRFSSVSPRLLARKGAHLSCRAFSAEAFTVENKSAIKFMCHEIEMGIAQLLTDEREAAVRHVLSRQKQRSARRQGQRLAEYRTRLAQLHVDAVGLVITSGSSRPPRRSADMDMIEMQTRIPSHATAHRRFSSLPARARPSPNPLASLMTVSTETEKPTDGAQKQADGMQGVSEENRILSLWRELNAARDGTASTWSSDEDPDAGSSDSMDSADLFREQDRVLANAELLGAHPLEEDNTVNPFSSGSIVKRFNRVGYPKSLLGVLLLSLMRFPSPPYHMVREVKREIMVRGLKGYILERAYDARFGVQQTLCHLPTATVTTTEGDDLGPEMSSVVDGVVVRPRASVDLRSGSVVSVVGGAPHGILQDDSGSRKYVWLSDQGGGGGTGNRAGWDGEANPEGSCRDPLLYPARDQGEHAPDGGAPGNGGGIGNSGVRPSRFSSALRALNDFARTFVGRPTVTPVTGVGRGGAGRTSPPPYASSTSPASNRAGKGSRHTPTATTSATRSWAPPDKSLNAHSTLPPSSVVEAYVGAAASGVIDQDFASIVERVLIAFMQYDSTELPRTGFARVSTLQGGEGDAWAESDVLNTLYLESVLPYIYRKFRLEPHHVDLSSPLCSEDRLIVYQRVCESLGVHIRDGRTESCLPSVKDFRPSCTLVSRLRAPYTTADPMSTQYSIPIGDGATGVRYTVPHWIRTRTDWLVRHLMLNPSATRQEWDLYGAALVPFLSIERQRCVPSTKAAIDRVRSSLWRGGGRGSVDGTLPLPPLAILGPMLLNQVQNMSTAPQLLWHAWAKDCYAFKDRDYAGAGIAAFSGFQAPRRGGGGSPAAACASPSGQHSGGLNGGAHSPPQNNGAFTLSLTSQGLDQSVEARRSAMRSAGDRACLVHLLRRQAATYAVLAREVTRQLRDVTPENTELVSRLSQIHNRASSASVTTMHSAIALADTLLEHLGNPYSFQYRRYSAELVRHMRARRDTLIAVPRSNATTPIPTDPNSLGSSSGRARASVRNCGSASPRKAALGASGMHDGLPASQLSHSSAGGDDDELHTHSPSASLLLNASVDTSLKLASDEEVALLHMLHQIQKYCSQDLLAALDHLQRGVLLFSIAYTQQQEALDEERTEEGLPPEDVVLNTRMNADPNTTESLETAYRLLRLLDGETGLYTLRALSNLCIYYYATGNFVNYQESLWGLRRSWANQGPPDIRGLIVATPADFAAARAAVRKAHDDAVPETEATVTTTDDGGDSRAAPDLSNATADAVAKNWMRRRKLKPIHFRHLDFCD